MRRDDPVEKKKILIIGGGLGGLSAAISLKKNPKYDVTIIEKNPHLGGKLNYVEKEGFSFDLGPSIYTMPHIFDRLFTMHGKKREDYYQIQPVRPHWRNFFEDGTTIDLEPNIDQMKNPPSSLSSHDLEDLRSFLSYSKSLYHLSDETYFKHQSEKVLDVARYYNPFTFLLKSDYFSTMDQGVRKRVKNPYMVDILNFFVKYVGSSPYDAPAILNLLPYVQWEFDLWYVTGGLYNLARGLEKLIDELGIKVMKNTEVVDVERSEKGIQALKIRTHSSPEEKNTETSKESYDIQTVSCDLVVSNMEVIPFYERITKEPSLRIQPYRDKYGPACSGFALHLGLDRKYKNLRHHNFFFAESGKKHFDYIFHTRGLTDDPTIYLVAPMKTDPDQGPEGGEVIKILPHIPVVDPENPFTEEDYETYKNHVLNKLERMGLTDLRKHIVTEELWTPEIIQDRYYSNQGAIYGVVSDKKTNKGFKTPKRSAFYDNLFFVGGSVNPGGGMPMVVLSGQQVVEQIDQI